MPNGGLEPPTLRLRGSCSTDWASQATHLSKIYFKYKSGDIHVLVPIKTPQTTIILDSGIECQCNSWKKLKLHRGCSEERWCVSIDFDLIIILACAHSIFSQLFRVSLLRPIFGHLWLAHFLDDQPFLSDIFHWILYYCLNSRVDCECNLATWASLTRVYFKRLRLTLETELELELHVFR